MLKGLSSAEVETKEYTDEDWAFIVEMALKNLGTNPTLFGKVLDLRC